MRLLTANHSGYRCYTMALLRNILDTECLYAFYLQLTAMNPIFLLLAFSVLCWLVILILLFAKLFLKGQRKENVDVIAFILIIISLLSLGAFVALSKR